MTINSNYDSTSADDLDFSSDETSSEVENDIAELELNINPSESANSKHKNKRNFLAKRKIEQLQEERLRRKQDEDYFDDWD
ncbi:hypothetical protein KO527_11645 [Pseudoalteromonas sp. C2R02]|uniref:hypothetical protein n=1 Tax=Pseudoalteromonas sp. C2R02 TaxID=2841565 RepID=UPI001C0905E5|nr:hypothetical protein [Pseudoalteromonas sp. C2R02]MBU2970004.1 hypothetical protein [Pseudoalteromonas sp. C2R02]